ncbi:MAG: dTDP-4-dehydrorhamnose 3,5-epimerase [Desulfobacterales bacterium]|nr:MAG: dTDP-4-dehydrorhamnose 3,5-epimerase [Desulfobacterales bacterium]
MELTVIPAGLPGLLIIEPPVFGDRRGFFMETHHIEKYRNAGIACAFVQDNLSFSIRGALRGLHFQLNRPQAKLVMAVTGRIFDVAVDIRKGSPHFGSWRGVELSAENHRQFYIPEGFAHGFCVLSESAHFLYKCSDLYAPGDEAGIRWDDPDIGIDWPLSDPVISDKDQRSPFLKNMPDAALPQFP